MNRQLLKKRGEPSLVLAEPRALKKAKESRTKPTSKTEMSAKDDALGFTPSSDDAATFLSDTFLSEAFTPFSSFSISSRATGYT